MSGHFVGKGQNSGEVPPTFDSSSSVVVQQFMALVRGEVGVHVPANDFRTLAVTAEEYICPKCKWKGKWDVWHGSQDGMVFMLGRCRCCKLELAL